MTRCWPRSATMPRALPRSSRPECWGRGRARWPTVTAYLHVNILISLSPQSLGALFGVLAAGHAELDVTDRRMGPGDLAGKIRRRASIALGHGSVLPHQ